MQIILIALLGLGVRLVNLNQSLWLDEAIETLAVKNHTFLGLLTNYVSGDFHPPLYHFILKIWTDVFGYSEIAVRFPSVIFSVLTIFFVYKIGCKVVSTRVGLLAALFFALNPLAVYYAQEARMYSLAMFFVSGAVWALLEERWPFFLTMVVGSLYTEYLPYLMVPVYFLMTNNKRQLLIIYCSLFILILPWLPFFLKQFHVGTSAASNAPLWGKVVGGFDIKAFPLTFVKFIIGRITLANKYVYAALILPIIGYYSWIFLRSRKIGLFYWLIIPLVLGAGMSSIIPVYSYFRFLFVVPAFCLILAIGTGAKLKLVVPVLLVSVVSLVIFNLNPNFYREDWRALAKAVVTDNAVVFMPSKAQVAPLEYYIPTVAVFDKDTLPDKPPAQVYLVRYVQEIFDPGDSARQYLDTRGYTQTGQMTFTSLVAWKYAL